MKNILLSFVLCLTAFYCNGQGYCTPSYYYDGCSSGIAHIASPSNPFVIAGVTTLVDTGSCSGAGSAGHYGYIDNTTTSITCALSAGATYSVTCGGSSSYTMSQQIWIDFDSDSTFQSSESVGGAVSGYTSPSIFTITLPTTGVNTGLHRMRVVTEYYYHTYPTLNPCPDGTTASSYYYGEIRDYMVNTSPNHISPSTLNFSTLALSTTSAPLTCVLTAPYLTPATGNITVTAPTNYSVCATAGGTYTNSYTIGYTGSALAATSIFVKFSAPATSGSYPGNVNITGGGITYVYAALAGASAPACSGSPAAGTVSASVPAADSTTPITLTDAGYSATGGIIFQWQSSPTGSSSWTDITGATTAVYSFAGITATTYYRCNVTCTYSSAMASTSPVAIIYSTGCSGTPSGGTAFASVTHCASCTETLSLTGYTAATRLTFQWQKSTDTTTGWTAISSASTSNTYTFAPTGDYYYRCAVRCTSSGLSGYSSAVHVFSQHHITTHSVTDSTSTVCNGPRFTVRSDSYGPLLKVVTWYGDGGMDTVSVSVASPYEATAYHAYAHSGAYTVKQLLLNGPYREDSITFTHNYFYCRTLPISFFIDIDGNGVFDTATDEINVFPVSVAVDSNGVRVDTVSALGGLYYQATGGPGTIYSFRVVATTSGGMVTSPSSGVIYDTINAAVNDYSRKYFGLGCSSASGFDLIQFQTVRASSHSMVANIYVQNSYCSAQTPVMKLVTSPKFFHFYSTVSPTSVSGTEIIWNLASLSFMSSPTTKHISCNLESPSGAGSYTAGDTVHSSFYVTPTSGDLDTSNNHNDRLDTIITSWDPNFIEAIPSGHIISGTTLRYTAGFENDGNDTAQNIYVLDTLSDYLDASTLKPVFASHEMYIEMQHVAGLTIVKFDFPHIKLLDSTHHGLCQGIFQYDIKVKDGLPDCTHIPARVGIYFDDNAVVMTNTWDNVVGCWPASVSSLQSAFGNLLVYPNPASDELNIKTAEGVRATYAITSSISTTLLGGSISSSTTKVDIKTLPAGIYYIKLTGGSGVEVRKFVKL